MQSNPNEPEFPQAAVDAFRDRVLALQATLGLSRRDTLRLMLADTLRGMNRAAGVPVDEARLAAFVEQRMRELPDGVE